MMDDGSGKCLLDVINDPNALQEFLRSTNQDKRLHTQMTLASQNVATRPAYINHSVPPTLVNTRGTQGTSVEKSLSTNAAHPSVVSRTPISDVNMPVIPQSTFTNAAIKNSNIIRTSGSTTSQTSGVGLVPSAVPISTGVNFIKTTSSSTAMETANGGVGKLGVPVAAVSTLSGSVGAQVGKPVVTSVSSFQAKKPIPIQPKTPSIPSVVNNSTTVQVQGNRLPNVQLMNPGVVNPLVTQKHPAVTQQTISPVGHHVSLNGVESKGMMKTNVNPGNVTSPKSSPVVHQQSHSTTPVKRIAPKQLNILPQTGVAPSPQMMSGQHKVILPQVSHQINPQTQGTISQVSAGNIQQQNQTQLIHAQQLLNLIRSQSPNVVTTQQTSQLVQSQPVPSNQIRQIQQLVQQKLSNQQQPQIVQTVQQKVLSPAQLQAALKQNQQLGTQNVQKSQPQNIVVQEEVITQLLQQVQQQQQQKSAQNALQQQQQLLQQLQQQQQLPGVQKQVLIQNLQPQAQQKSPLQVKMGLQEKVPGQNQRTGVVANPVGVQLQQIGDHQQKQLQQILGQQHINLSPQQKLVVTRDQGQKQMQCVTFTQGQGVRTASPQVLQQGIVQQAGIVQQQGKPVFQQLKPMATPGLQIVTTTQQTAVPQTQQQHAQNVGVQKVFIIKQPELLQKLGLQGAKTQQTIQITPQQLQALKQLQLQQQVQQKLLSNNLQTGGNLQTKVVMTDQLKQLQQQLQGTVVKQVTLQGRTPQTLQQQRQVTVKSQAKMQHIPRILQTSGRQPVSQSGVKVSLPIKQEPNKGVKRPHSSDAAEVPKVATRLKQGLLQDQQAVLHPDVMTPFLSREDVIKRLAPYHVSYDPSLTPSEVQKADGVFSAVSTQLVKRSQRMMERHRQLLFDESMREHPSAEMVMLYRVFLTDERAALAQDKKLAKEQPLEIAAVSKGENTAEEVSPALLNTTTKEDTTRNLPRKSQTATSTTTVASENDFVRSMKDTVSVASSNISSLLNTTALPRSGNTASSSAPLKTGTSSSPLRRSTQTLPCSNASSVSNHVTSLSSAGIKQTSQLQASGNLNHKIDNSELDNFDASLDVVEDSPMEIETEKEDVTATLALLNSMASELDEVLDVEGAI